MSIRTHHSTRSCIPIFGLIAVILLSTAAITVAQVADDTTGTPEQPPMLVVIASGTGVDEAAALKQAFSNAVQQAVGTLVDAETIVKNDQVIREQILTASNAIVARYDPIGKPSVDSGLITVRIRAEVEKRTLMERLEKASVIRKSVEGKDLFAQLVTDANREKDQTAMIRRLFEGFPANVMKATPVGEPRAVRSKTEGEDPQIVVTVQLGTDPEKYEKWRKAVLPLLTKMASKIESKRLEFDKAATNWNFGKGGGYATMAAYLAFDHTHKYDKKLPWMDLTNYHYFELAMASFGASVPNGQIGHSYMGDGFIVSKDPHITVYEYGNNPAGVELHMDDQAIAQVSRSATRELKMTIALIDGIGKEIAGTEATGKISQEVKGDFVISSPSLSASPVWVGFNPDLPSNLDLPSKCGEYNVVCILPYVGYSGLHFKAFFPFITRDFAFNVPLERVKDIKSVEVKLSSP